MTEKFFVAELIRVGDSQGVFMKLFGEEIVKTGFDTKADASRAIELVGKVLSVTKGILTQMRADIDEAADNAPDDISAGKAAYRTADGYFDKVFDLPPRDEDINTLKDRIRLKKFLSIAHSGLDDEGTAEQAEGLNNDR